MRMKVCVQPTASDARWCWLVHCPVCNEPDGGGPRQWMIGIPHDTPGPANEWAMMHLWQHGGEL